MDLSDEVKESAELAEDKNILIYLKSALRYCNKYERYELESDYIKAYNYVENAIAFFDSNELGGYYFDFRRFHTKPLGCLVSLSILILLIMYINNVYENGHPLGGLPMFSFVFSTSIFLLWEAYRLEDSYDKVRGWVILIASFLFLVFGNGYL